jgi:hypothetical protein
MQWKTPRFREAFEALPSSTEALRGEAFARP